MVTTVMVPERMTFKNLFIRSLIYSTFRKLFCFLQSGDVQGALYKLWNQLFQGEENREKTNQIQNGFWNLINFQDLKEK